MTTLNKRAREKSIVGKWIASHDLRESEIPRQKPGEMFNEEISSRICSGHLYEYKIKST
jgi:hypothetical protein